MTNNKKLFADQIRKLYENTLFGSAATLINGAAMIFVLRNYAAGRNLMVWLCCAVLVSALRMSLYWRYRKAAPSCSETAKWKFYFLGSLFLAGALWGAAAVFLFPPYSVGHQAFVAFVTGGMVAGAAGSFSAVLSAFYLYSIPALSPIIIRFFSLGGEIHFAMGAMALLYLMIISLTAHRIHKDYVNLLSLRYENSELLEGLRSQNQQIEQTVAERTEELRDAVKMLRKENKERRKAAKALKDSQQRMQAIIDYAPLIIWAVDQDGIFTFSEGKGLEKIGLKSGEAVGHSVNDVFPQNERIIRDTERALSGELISGAATHMGVVYECRWEPIKDDANRIIGAIGVAIDITAHRKAQEALREREEKYRELVENINDIFFAIDNEFRVTYISPVVKSVLGYRPEEMLGIKFLDFVDSNDQDILKADFEQVLDKRGKANDYRFLGKSGRIQWCRASIRPILKNGQVVGLQGILADITHSKLLEEQLRRAQKMEALGTLAGGVAHDLNNILTGIVSYPDLLLLDLPPDSPMREPISTIKSSGEKAAAVVQDLLTLARRGVTATELLNLNFVIEEYLESPEFKNLCELYPKIHIRKKLQADLFNMSGSRVHIFKTLMNLISNAAEATPKGGIIEIETTNQYRDAPVAGFDTVAEGEYVVLTVSDSGVGIAEDDLARIFEPFYTKKTMGRSGSGLGMAVVWGVVKDHGGFIDVKSREGAGSCFKLFFPVARKSLPNSNRTVRPESYEGAGELILVVDDVSQQREIAVRMLSRLGYRADSVRSGEKAIEYLTVQKPDIIILDMIMTPGIDGYETYKEILKINPKQKAIIVSGYSETEQVRKTLALGAGKYIKKPYTLENIGAAIKSELEA